MSLPNPAPLTDRDALVRNRTRARDEALFLHRTALDEVQDRLSTVNRRFKAPAVVSGFPQIWGPLAPGAKQLRDDEVLDLTPAAHDLVIHALCLHWANDPVGQLIQCRRALTPDGLFLGIMFGGQSLHELRTSLSEAEAQLRGGLSPRVAPMGEIRDLGALLQRAGFALPVADAMTVRVTYPNLRALLRDLRHMGEANALSARSREFTPGAVFDRAEEIYRAHFATPEGRLTTSFEFITLTGWAPDSSQQQPLRPGSAKVRLAEALKVPEIKLPD